MRSIKGRNTQWRLRKLQKNWTITLHLSSSKNTTPGTYIRELRSNEIVELKEISLKIVVKKWTSWIAPNPVINSSLAKCGLRDDAYSGGHIHFEIFPVVWRGANAATLFKKAEERDNEEYQPANLLSLVRKMLEFVMAELLKI